MTQRAELEIVARARDEASRTLAGLKGAILGIGVAAVAAGVGAAIMGVRFAAGLEQAQIGFTTMLGSGEKAKAFLDDLQRFAAKTPFQFSELLGATRRLMAMGFAAEDVLPIMTAVGDAVSAMGLGAEAVDRVTIAIGQMATSGRVNAQDMMQLTSVGIKAWDYLAKATGKSIAEVRKLSEAGMLDSATAIKVILYGMQQEFKGAMENQSKSFLGLMSTIKDEADITLGKIMQPLFEQMKLGAATIAQFAETKAFDDMAKGAAQSFSNLFTFLTQEAIPNAIGALTVMKRAWDTLGEAGQRALLGLAVLMIVGGPVVGAIGNVYNAVVFVKEAFLRLFTLVKVGLATSFAAGAAKALGALALIVTGFSALAYAAVAAFGIITGGLSRVAEGASDFLTMLADGLRAIGQTDMAAGLQTAANSFSLYSANAKAWSRNAANSIKGVVDEIGRLAGEALEGAKEVVPEWINLGEIGRKSMAEFTAALQDAGKEAQKALDIKELEPPDISKLITAAKDAKDALKEAGISVQDVAKAIAASHPLVRQLDLRIVGLNDQIEATSIAMAANQRVQDGIQSAITKTQERVSNLSDELAKAKQRLQEFTTPRLTGMTALDQKIFDTEMAIKRLQYRKLGGKMLPGMGEATGNLTRLGRELERLRLQRDILYEPQLRQLQLAAAPLAPEMGFEQALAGIQATSAQIGSLEKQLATENATLKAQQAQLAGVRAEYELLSGSLKDLQENLKAAEAMQKLATDALMKALLWILDERDAVIKLGGAFVQQAGIIDTKMRAMLAGFAAYSSGTTAISSKALQALVAEFSTAQAGLGLQAGGAKGFAWPSAGAPPTPTAPKTTAFVPGQQFVAPEGNEFVVYAGGQEVSRKTTLAEAEREYNRIMGLQSGGLALPGRDYMVGEAGPELFTPRRAGTIVPNDALRQSNDNRQVTVNVYGGGNPQDVVDRFAADPRLRDYLQPRKRF